MRVDVTIGHLSSLNYILVSLVFFHTFFIFSLCLWIGCIFWRFLPAYLSQCFCLGFVYPSSFSIGLYTFFLQLQPSILRCVRHINFIAFSFDYIMSFRTNYSNFVLHSFSLHCLPRFNMRIFDYSICLL